MQDKSSRLTDDLARMFNDAAGLAGGVRREIEAVVRTQMERMMAKMNVVSREDFEAVQDMAALARVEGERLAVKLAQLEKQVAALEADQKK